MDVYIIFFVLWCACWITWFILLFSQNQRMKKILGTFCIIGEFFFGMMLAPLLLLIFPTESVVVDFAGLIFIFAPMFIMAIILSRSIKKSSPAQKKLNLSARFVWGVIAFFTAPWALVYWDFFSGNAGDAAVIIGFAFAVPTFIFAGYVLKMLERLTDKLTDKCLNKNNRNNVDFKIDVVPESQEERTVQTIKNLAFSESEEENICKEKVNLFKEEFLGNNSSDKTMPITTSENKIQLTERQKIFRCFLILDIIMLALAIIAAFDRGFDAWYYVCLRFVTCVALAGFVLEKLSTWFKFILLLLVILYNPVVPVHLGDRGIWVLINLITIILLCCGAVAVHRQLKTGVTHGAA